MSHCSFARTPIGRGIRARKYKTQASNNQIILSDEEGNTSEYSHSPSSVHSTLESNPDIASIYKKVGISIDDAVDDDGAHGRSLDHSGDDDSSSDESDLNAAITTQSSISTIIENINDEK